MAAKNRKHVKSINSNKKLIFCANKTKQTQNPVNYHESDLLAQLESFKSTKTCDCLSLDLVQQCQDLAAKLLHAEQYKISKKSQSNFIQNAIRSGTVVDKVMALTQAVMEFPQHNVAYFETLVNMAKKKCRREAILAADAIKGIVTADGSPIPDDRKLIEFRNRQFTSLWKLCSGDVLSVKKELVLWYTEHLFKQKYAEFVRALNENTCDSSMRRLDSDMCSLFLDEKAMSCDTVSAVREKALCIMHCLLARKPEQEEVLLPFIINKVGDPNHKVASKACYLLLKLFEEHPNMKMVIVEALEDLVYRPNIASQAQYYAICLVNQIRFCKDDDLLAARLIKMYFSFFKSYVKQGVLGSKMMAALLTGVNRSYPFAKALASEQVKNEVNTLYKIVHNVNFTTSIQALMLLHQLIDPCSSHCDRFFMALYRKILDPGLAGSTKLPLFLNLVYKSMKSDVVEKRSKAILKRLMQRGVQLGPNILCAALLVVSEIVKDKPCLLMLKQHTSYSCETDDDEEHFEDQTLSEEFQDVDYAVHPKQQDVSLSSIADGLRLGDASHQCTVAKPRPPSSWIHKQNNPARTKQQDRYDPLLRNPLYCLAESECLWELLILTKHHHPSVRLYASRILQGKNIECKGNPLEDYSLIRFLDRFVYKNPKKLQDVGAMETVGKAHSRNILRKIIPVNSAKFRDRDPESVPVHEQYLYVYQCQAAEKKLEETADDSDVSDTDFDAYLTNMESAADLDNIDFSSGMSSSNNLSRSAFFEHDEEIDIDDDDDGGGGLSDDGLAEQYQTEMVDADFSYVESAQPSNGDLIDARKRGTKRNKKDVARISRKRPNGGDVGRTVGKKAKRISGGDMSGAAAADEFANIIESRSEFADKLSGTTDAVNFGEETDVKQLAWERKRWWQGGDGRGNRSDRRKKRFTSSKHSHQKRNRKM